MRLRTALNDYKRDRSDARRYPGERRTVEGAFSGYGDRLVHVDPSGGLRDFSSSLSGLYGIDRSRLGIRTGSRTRWFDGLDTIRQHYYRDTNLVETEYDVGEFTVHQYDLTLGRAHVTHVELRGEVPAQAHLVAFLTLAPEGRDTRIGRLIHEGAGPDGSKAVEVFHHREHDYVTASTGIDRVEAQVPERFEELLAEEPVEFPRDVALNRYEDTHLSGDVLVRAPLERAGPPGRRSSPSSRTTGRSPARPRSPTSGTVSPPTGPRTTSGGRPASTPAWPSRRTPRVPNWSRPTGASSACSWPRAGRGSPPPSSTRSP
jgi:hypothetical protein